MNGQSGERVPKRPKKIQNEDINREAFQNSANINLLQIQNNLHNYDLRNQETLDKVFNQLESSIYNTALQCRSTHSVDNPAQPCTTTDVNDIYAIKERLTNHEIRKWNKILSSKDPKELWNEIECFFIFIYLFFLLLFFFVVVLFLFCFVLLVIILIIFLLFFYCYFLLLFFYCYFFIVIYLLLFIIVIFFIFLFLYIFIYFYFHLCFFLFHFFIFSFFFFFIFFI